MQRPERSPAARYERSDMRARVVVAAVIGLLLALLLALVFVTVLQSLVTGVPASISRPADLIGGLQASPAPTPAAPRLEAESGQAFAAYRAASEQKLNSYRWVDRNSGVVAIPIERAMDLVAERGLPTRGSVTGAGTTSPTSASSGRVEAPYP